METKTTWNFQEDAQHQPLMQLPSQQLSVPVDPAEKLLANSLISHRPSFAHVSIKLADDQKVIANAGSMLWMESSVKLSTGCHGGCCNSWLRTLALESFCQNEFQGPGDVAFGFDVPGDILPFAVTPSDGWIVGTGAFVCGTPNVVVSATFPGCATCCCAGEGLFLTHIGSSNGKGVFYAGDYGALQRHEVAAGKTFCVSIGRFFACSDKTEIHIGLAAGIYTCICGHEGFMMKFKGPCAVYTQNRNPDVFRSLLNPLPQQADSGASGADALGSVAGAV